jgi:hypothetical protein
MNAKTFAGENGSEFLGRDERMIARQIAKQRIETMEGICLPVNFNESKR